jgi:hypothetical protein
MDSGVEHRIVLQEVHQALLGVKLLDFYQLRVHVAEIFGQHISIFLALKPLFEQLLMVVDHRIGPDVVAEDLPFLQNVYHLKENLFFVSQSLYRGEVEYFIVEQIFCPQKLIQVLLCAFF